MTAVLWDLDGTLVDSAGDIAAGVDRMLVRTGRPPLGEAVVRGFIGDGARKLVDRCVAAAGDVPRPADLEVFLEEYRAGLVDRTRLYAGIAELLDAVEAPQAVVTNKPEELSRRILAALGLAHHFHVVIGGDTFPVRKPDPEPVRAALWMLGAVRGVFVGDGPADVGAAKAAGVPMIGVAWGIARPAGADVVVETVAGLRDELARRGVRVR